MEPDPQVTRTIVRGAVVSYYLLPNRKKCYLLNKYNDETYGTSSCTSIGSLSACILSIAVEWATNR